MELCIRMCIRSLTTLNHITSVIHEKPEQPEQCQKEKHLKEVTQEKGQRVETNIKHTNVGKLEAEATTNFSSDGFEKGNLEYTKLRDRERERGQEREREGKRERERKRNRERERNRKRERERERERERVERQMKQ